MLLLLSMAALPVFAPKFWTRHHLAIAFGLGAVTIGYYFFGLHASEKILHTAHEYVSFIALIGSLFVVSGGIHIVVKGESSPSANVIFLLIGALLANVLGTTGAAILLIRPWIRVNRHRIRAYHIVFFIFLVANIGGCLTPIGDPPLFLGFLQGVPFWWVAKNCWPMWALAVGMLLAIFYAIDRVNFNRAPKKDAGPEAWQFDGFINLIFLAVILGAVFIEKPIFLREGIMMAAAAASYFVTRRHDEQIHRKNEFEFAPVKEVAVLFGGIFSTMMPALDWLNAHARDILGANPRPEIFYWSAGSLSAVLDNAPTYLGFLSALQGMSGAQDIQQLLNQNAAGILAVSIGAVFFGAATYIGNGPNFMIKSISDRQQIQTPSFAGYIFKFTLPFLAPVLVFVWLIFFR